VCFQLLLHLVLFYSSVQLTSSSSSTVSIFRDSVGLQQNKPWTACRFLMNQILICCCNFHFPADAVIASSRQQQKINYFISLEFQFCKSSLAIFVL